MQVSSSVVNRPHGLVDLLIILATFGLLQFSPPAFAALRFTFVTACCPCHAPSLVVVLNDESVRFETSEGRRFAAPVSQWAQWRTLLEVPEYARSSPSTVRLDVGDDVELETLVAVIDRCREVGFTDVQVAPLTTEGDLAGL